MVLSFAILLAIEGAAAPIRSYRGAQFVEAAAVAHETGITVKRLPGSDAVAVCLEDRCAAIEGAFEEQGTLWLPLETLTAVLGLRAQPGEEGRSVVLTLGPSPVGDPSILPKVGSLAPDFRLPRLQGATVALSDFRGQRVLINSWASW